MCSKLRESSGPQSQDITGYGSSWDSNLCRLPDGGFPSDFLWSLSSITSTISLPPTEMARAAPVPRQFDKCVLANCVKDGSPLASVTSLLLNQSGAPWFACEKGVCCQGG